MNSERYEVIYKFMFYSIQVYIPHCTYLTIEKIFRKIRLNREQTVLKFILMYSSRENVRASTFI